MNDEEVARWARFFAPADPTTAVAVALAEHGGNVNASATNRNNDGSTDSGVWQINSVHQRAHPTWTVEALKDPELNARAMGVLSRGGLSFSAWTGTYVKGLHRPYMERAQLAVGATKGGNALGGTIDDPLGTIDDVTSNPLDTIQDLTNTIGGFFEWLTDPDTWRRVALVSLGAAVAVVGVVVIARGTEVGQTVEKAATGAASAVTKTKG